MRAVTNRISLVTLAFAGLAMAQSSRAATMTVDGALPSTADQQLELMVTIDGVTAAQYADAASDPTDPAAQLEARFQVKDATHAYRLDEERDHKESVSSDGSTHTFVYYLLLTNWRFSATPLQLDLSFSLGGSTPDKLVASLTGVTVAPPTDLSVQPDTPGIVAGKGSLTAMWTPAIGDPASMTIYVVDPNAGKTVHLPAFKVNGVPGRADVADKCTWDSTSDFGDCVTCPDNSDSYLDPTTIGAISGVIVKTVNTLDGQATVDGLKAGTKYSVFFQFAPKGVAIGQCMPAYPF